MQKISYMGNGVTTEFVFNFPYYEKSNIVVTMNNQPATGYDIIVTKGGQDSDIPYIGGKVVFDTAPTQIDCITIERKLPLTRPVDHQATAQINPKTLNMDMNYAIELIKDMKSELDTLRQNYDQITNTESLENLLQQANSVNKLIASGEIMQQSKIYSYMTNCITKISQDIKLELSNGVLILKSGSKVYVPNGVGVFDIVTISSDKSITNTSNDKYLVWANSTGSAIGLSRLSTQTGSGTSTPTTGYWAYYNINDNKVYHVANGVVDYTCSLPIAVITVSGGAISGIDQLFNGIGYIGSTVFVLPGVGTLIPNGRNTDGTLKNIRYTTTTIALGEMNLTDQSVPLWLKYDGTLGFSTGITYNSTTNTTNPSGYVQLGDTDLTSGVISNFAPKLPIRIADLGDLNA